MALTWQQSIIQGKLHHWKKLDYWSPAKLFIMQNYTDNANGDVQKLCDISLSSSCAHVLFCGRKPKVIKFSL